MLTKEIRRPISSFKSGELPLDQGGGQLGKRDVQNSLFYHETQLMQLNVDFSASALNSSPLGLYINDMTQCHKVRQNYISILHIFIW